MKDKNKEFQQECEEEIDIQGNNLELRAKSMDWLINANSNKYSYHFRWMDRPIIQYPQDIQMMQELIMKVRPDLIIETGIAHGGSIIFSASMLALLDLHESIEKKETYNFSESKRKVLALDIDIREHNKAEILMNPFSNYIEMWEGSSVDTGIINKVKSFVEDYKKIMIFLDSNHTHDHVLEELKAYANLVSVGSYVVVFDTIIEHLPQDLLPNESDPSTAEARTYTKGNSPMTAVKEFLKTNSNFEIDKAIDNKLLISVAPEGYLKRIS